MTNVRKGGSDRLGLRPCSKLLGVAMRPFCSQSFWVTQLLAVLTATATTLLSSRVSSPLDTSLPLTASARCPHCAGTHWQSIALLVPHLGRSPRSLDRIPIAPSNRIYPSCGEKTGKASYCGTAGRIKSLALAFMTWGVATTDEKGEVEG